MANDGLLITGVAGFIGMHTALAYLEAGRHVFGIDSLNDYYDPELKVARLSRLKQFDNFEFSKTDLLDLKDLDPSSERVRLVK